VQALGLTGNFRWNGYGQYSPYPGGNFAFPQYGGYGANGVGSYGASGNTLYGYSVQTLKDYYGSTDLNALYQAASRLTQGAQGLAGQAHTEFSQLVGQAGDNAGRVAEILARSQAAANALNATDPQARTRESSSTTVIRSGTGTPPAVPLPDPPVTGVTLAPANAQTFIQKVGGPQCGQCHGDTDPKGKFKISDYPKMTPEEKGKVIFRLTTLDKSKMMPRLTSGEPGQPVSRETLIEFLRH
jgi:hypothetical protein